MIDCGTWLHKQLPKAERVLRPILQHCKDEKSTYNINHNLITVKWCSSSKYTWQCSEAVSVKFCQSNCPDIPGHLQGTAWILRKLSEMSLASGGSLWTLSGTLPGNSLSAPEHCHKTNLGTLQKPSRCWTMSGNSWHSGNSPDTQETLRTLFRHSLKTCKHFPDTQECSVYVYSITEFVRHMYSETQKGLYSRRSAQPFLPLDSLQTRCKPSNIPSPRAMESLVCIWL